MSTNEDSPRQDSPRQDAADNATASKDAARQDHASNPFSTRFIRPDRLPYQIVPGCEPDIVWERLSLAQYVGQIIGPHGVGKTALLHRLTEIMSREGLSWDWQTIRTGIGSTPDGPTLKRPALKGHTKSDILVLEGAELLSTWDFARIAWRARRGYRTLVTAHRVLPTIPVIAELQSRREIAESIVTKLLEGRTEVIEASELESCYNKHHGDLREMLMELYDAWEARQNP